MNEITEEIMQQVLEELITHNKYKREDLLIIENIIQIDKNFFLVTFDKPTNWDYKIFYDIKEPEVYLVKKS